MWWLNVLSNVLRLWEMGGKPRRVCFVSNATALWGLVGVSEDAHAERVAVASRSGPPRMRRRHPHYGIIWYVPPLYMHVVF